MHLIEVPGLPMKVALEKNLTFFKSLEVEESIHIFMMYEEEIGPLF